MTFGELLNEYDEQGKKIVRLMEATEKNVNARLAVVFNKECIILLYTAIYYSAPLGLKIIPVFLLFFREI